MSRSRRKNPTGGGRTLLSSGASVGQPAGTATASRGGGTWLRGPVWIALALVALNAFVFAPVVHFDFVTWDDPEYVYANPQVSHGLTAESVKWAFTGYKYYWHPLTWLSHMLDVQLYGLNPGPHHVTNVLIHTLSTLLLFALLRRITGHTGRSAFVAGLFAVHPLRVESVAWVAERKDVLSTLLWLVTIWVYLDYARRPRKRRYAMVLLCFTLALMAKPMVMTLPLVLLLLDYWPLGRLRHPGTGPAEGRTSGREAFAQLPLPALVKEKLPLAALAAAVGAATYVLIGKAGAVGGLEQFPLGLRIGNALVSFMAYLGMMLWPVGLAALYPYPRAVPGWWAAASLLALTGGSLLAFHMARRLPYVAVGWFWYVISVAPALGLIQAGSQARADRFTYIPLIGIFVIVAWGVPDLLARWSGAALRGALAAAAVAVMGASALAAREQVHYWENSAALWTRVAAVTHDNPVGDNNLGLILEKEGKVDDAIRRLSESVRLSPGFAEAHNNLGAALGRKGRFVEAVAHFSEAVRLDAGFKEAHNNLAVALENQGKGDEALPHVSEALRLDPDYASAHKTMGLVLAKKGRLEEAIAQFAEALKLQPDFADAATHLVEAHHSLGLALARQGRLDEAISHLSEALRLQPGSAEAHNNLANVLGDRGRSSEASAHYTEALRLRPDYVNARNNLGLTLADQGRTGEAMQQFAEVLKLDPGNAQARQMMDRLTAGRPAAAR